MANYLVMAGLGVTNLMTTFTHGLGIPPANLVARPIIHQAAVTCTAPLIVGTIGTNIITVAGGGGTLTTFDLEIMQIYDVIR